MAGKHHGAVPSCPQCGEETYCIYCQREFGSSMKLKVHVIRQHAGTYRAMAYQEHLEVE